MNENSAREKIDPTEGENTDENVYPSWKQDDGH